MKSNRLIQFVSLACLLIGALFIVPAVSAQVSAPVQADTQLLTPEVQGFVTSLLVNLTVNHPWIATVIALIGSMRLWAKPAFSALHAFAELTPNTWDDNLWAKVYSFFTENTVGRFLAYLLDWIGSVKIVPPASSGKTGGAS